MMSMFTENNKTEKKHINKIVWQVWQVYIRIYNKYIRNKHVQKVKIGKKYRNTLKQMKHETLIDYITI